MSSRGSLVPDATGGGSMGVTVSKRQNLVGGEWVDAVDRGTMEVLNPATGETIAEVPRGTEADVDRAVAAAKKALPEWLETTPGDRAEGEEIEMGPVISRSQQERVLGFLDRAKGAKVLTGGGTNGTRGFFVN